MIGIYKITSPSKKVYIGQSWNINIRKGKYKRHNCKAQCKLYASLEKYGFEHHKFEILKQFNDTVSQNDLDFYEEFYINIHKNSGIEMLNIKDGGSNGKLSEETKKKISLSKSGKPGSDEFKKKCSIRMKEYWEEYRRLGVKKKRFSYNVGEDSYWKGKKFSEEHRKRLSESHKKNK